MGDIVNGPIGTVGKYDISFSGGVFTATESAGVSGVSEQVVVTLDGGALIDALPATVPTWVKIMLKAALSAI